MKEQNIKKLLKEIKLEDDCLFGEIKPLIKQLKSNKKPQIKLYIHVDDACVENDSFEWYLLDDVIRFNLNRVIPFHDCSERECNAEGCVISLIAKVYDNPKCNPDYRYSKINKLEIIYI